ncbi:GNAT family N-acetyltransferase [Spirosoma sp. HMF4905]|uniref:GNAT family N-acetyltransferase n=1 Tax=Spirosoma arboris TaxID=2682092 RepID=A0A7K1SJQ6_9BACT|nr:bifunctional helix-turn-helix transcriptional regulator/GNAT family N-acetyltransferase [Spirosoma arboris]MVM33816.1 GNAT family N-acetyltransferase [Spirosoma arboris]
MEREIKQIRSFNRFYTSHLGLLNQHILQSSYSLAEIRVLYEIGQRHSLTAQELSDQLNLDKGYLSRIIKLLSNRGLLTKVASASDGRAYDIQLTEAGRALLDVLQAKSDEQIDQFLLQLSPSERAMVVNAMKTIEDLFSTNYTSQLLAQQVVYQEGLKPGDIGYLIYLHGVLYAQEEGYSQAFEGYVVKTFYDFLEHYNADKDKIWLALYHDQIIGCIAIQSRPNDEAQVRWFLVHPVFRGTGIGKKLLETALAYCTETAFRRVYLLTTDVQQKAISMYKKAGFALSTSIELNQWGQLLREERYDLIIGEVSSSS